ncbi:MULTISPECIES: NAD(P)/FAD-dependent oxidoreductase [Acidobacteriaceae]|uniref:phytoene desaturase family protein n=1 Tax=Acidobacteriaceae TaxID=204434 RepID=UPI00131E6E63|nr:MULTISPECIES: NAD(P)/FAD-dependent oxidoreductase [Acidobacteriaceae]MDW5266055.1 NAD(P)/FAD-dependent oxidoreductase [Edaphobacter sp.]
MAGNLEGAVVVGAGPNGLAAAITLQRAGVQVRLLEGRSTVGGGMRTASLTLPGFHHDVCSAVHPMAVLSPFFQTLPLERYGLQFIDPPVLAAHPFDDGSAAQLLQSFDRTAELLGRDGDVYRRLVGSLLPLWPVIADDVLGPLGLPSHPIDLARFGLKALSPATLLAKLYHSEHGKGLFAGMAAHSMQPLSSFSTSAIALVLSVAGHLRGWPIPRGGSQSIADAMASYFLDLGGVIETDVQVTTLAELPKRHVVLLDLGPRQLIAVAGKDLAPGYLRQLGRFKYGPGVFKMDWALAGPIPFTADACLHAGTVHIGGTFAEVATSEEDANRGRISEKPFVLLAQQSRFDRTRAPDGKETAWAYCHVPNGSTVDMTEAIERQIERFAPGFRDLILARHTMQPIEMERYNPNYIGGDINGGAMNLAQIFARPVARISPYKTSLEGVYLCSASTPPGGGVHGHCGYHAARQALKDHFPDHAGKVIAS